MSSPSFTAAGRVYLRCLVLGGAAAITASAVHLVTAPVPPQWILLGVLGAISGAAVLRLRVVPATFSMGDTFSFTALFLYGPEAATVTVALETLAISWRLGRRRRVALVRLLFNVAAPALAMWLAGVASLGTLELTTAPQVRDHVVALLGRVVLAAALFFALNSGFIATAVALESGERPLTVWRQHFLGLWTGPFTGAYVGALLAFLTPGISGPMAILFLPIPLILYFAFRTWLGSVDADLNHLSAMERAYNSMIHAFATAIDSKDQVTHGHIQRVQVYALALARELGVTDERELKAIEAAALLHDLGKIGIPDHILNKPGPLTPAEFEVMKQHVAIGTDILASIEFPYPVIPIVRSHHECWNGQGYPDRLSGTDIPTGARVLSVVDCFDALTSDRPYRARMTPSDAFAIIMERRGTMYEPAVVDAFRRIQEHIDIPRGEHLPRSVPFREKDVSL